MDVMENVLLHPMVLINISDHYTRFKVIERVEQPEAFGVLLGRHTGRHIEVHNSFELPAGPNGGQGPTPGIVADIENLMQMYQQVYNDLEFIGWYCTVSVPEERHVTTHAALRQFHDNPIFLAANLNVPKGQESLPVRIFETSVDVLPDGTSNATLIPTTFRLETSDAERVAIDHLASATPAGSGSTANMMTMLSSKHTAITMLRSRIDVILRYVRDVQNGVVPADHDILRAIGALANHLPRVGAEQPDSVEASAQRLCDAMLVTQMSALTKNLATLSDLIDKANFISSERRGKALSSSIK